MILTEWTPSTLIDTDRVFFQRTTISFRGVTISREGNYNSPPEFSERRYSIIEQDSAGVWLIIGSTLYTDGFDSENMLEPLNKYASGQFQTLVKLKFNGTLEEALTVWFGSSQQLRTLDTTPNIREV